MKRDRLIFHTLSALIVLTSLLIANFALAIVESGASITQLFGETSDFARIGLALGLMFSMLQVALVIGGVLIAYANAYEKGLFD